MNLKKINEKFLDRFIRLESLCAKRFGVVTAGVTEYISRLNRAEHADGRDEALRQLNNPQNDAGLLQKFQQLKNPQPAPQQEGPQILLNQ